MEKIWEWISVEHGYALSSGVEELSTWSKAPCSLMCISASLCPSLAPGWLQWERWGSLCSAAVAHSPCTQSGLPHALKVLGSWVHLGPALQCQFFVTPPLVTNTASVNGQSLAKILPWPQIYKVMVTAQPSKILGLVYRRQNMTLQDQLL